MHIKQEVFVERCPCYGSYVIIFIRAFKITEHAPNKQVKIM